jgi:hypothetical protein
MYRLPTSFQRRIFLSISGDSGRKAADSLISEWSAAGYGSSQDFWAYHHDSAEGASLIGEYLSQLYNSHFYVPVLTTDFTDRNSLHIEEELNAAVSVQHELQTMLSDYRFILPYFPNGPVKEERMPHLLRGRVGSNAAATAKALHQAITVSEGLEKFRSNPRSLEDWPDLLFDQGVPDAMFVIGHTAKEGKLIKQRVDAFRKWGLLERDLESEELPQSLRPAQMVPSMQRYLYDVWLSRRSNNSYHPLPEFKCEIDRHLINYRYDFLGQHNLICLGAGDTNWISRAILRYYRSALLGIRFGKPGSSQSIVINTRNHEKGKAGKLVLGQVEDNMSSIRRINQVEANDDLYSALIIVLPNPWNTKKSVLICAGLTGLGTQAAMFALMSPDFKERIKERQFSHVVVIKGKEQEWLPIGYEVVSEIKKSG